MGNNIKATPTTPAINTNSAAYKNSVAYVSNLQKAREQQAIAADTALANVAKAKAAQYGAGNAQLLASYSADMAAAIDTKTTIKQREIDSYISLRTELQELVTKVANKYDLKNYSTLKGSGVRTVNGQTVVTIGGPTHRQSATKDVPYLPIEGAPASNITSQVYYLNVAIQDVNSTIKTKRTELTATTGLTSSSINAHHGSTTTLTATALTGGGGGGSHTKPKPVHTPAPPAEAVKYNIPSVTEAYFNMTSGYENNVLLTNNTNRPAQVAAAKELWLKAGSHKGMIQSFVIPKQIGASSSTAGMTPELYANKNINTSKYAFQFLYNPGTIEMNYAGAPAVDIGLELSGRDKIPLIGSAATSSTISFQLLINRMPDMKYLGTQNNELNLASRQDLGAEYLRSNADNFTKIYGKQVPVEDLQQIRDRGTMYDVEFLLRTLIGYALPSTLRGFTTSDVGYLGAYPVELHLGKSLRYLVTVSSFSLNHTIFTEDMVPVFTNMTINCNRLPDYPFNYTALDSAYSGSLNKITPTNTGVSSTSSGQFTPGTGKRVH